MTAAGLPHSETPGSQPACGSPGTIAACRVLLRLSVPRHPPCALISLGRIFSGPTRKPAYLLTKTDAHVETPQVFSPNPATLPIPVFSIKPGVEECFALLQPFYALGRSASRAFVQARHARKHIAPGYSLLKRR
jgi:hypothetical protein